MQRHPWCLPVPGVPKPLRSISTVLRYRGSSEDPRDTEGDVGTSLDWESKRQTPETTSNRGVPEYVYPPGVVSLRVGPVGTGCILE